MTNHGTLPEPPQEALADDHALAAWLASTAGELLLTVRTRGLEGRELKDTGDREAEELLAALLRRTRPDDAVLSEEAVDDRSRLDADRVWIVDPLDGTREFSERDRDDWAVHVALWERDAGDGRLSAGAVALPARGVTFHTGTPPQVPASPDPRRPRIAVSRTRPPAFVTELAEIIGADLVPMGSAGVKVMSVLDGGSDAYVHAGGQYEWDSAAPVAVARAAGMHTSRVDGSELVYNRSEVLLPDLVVCRPELRDLILTTTGQLSR